MNQLEKKIEQIYKGLDHSNEEGIKALSQFFLEEIKEAYMKSFDDNGDDIDQNIEWVEHNFKDYLKSKYNIED